MGEQTGFCYRGAIVRIKICNFMTYNDTQLTPGPNLNMILGPNGTGKSAVVCCIIIGLAGDVSLTGRGSSVTDFVKKDKDFCITEIELYNDVGDNYTVRRKIIITNRSQNKIDHKSEWKINDTSVPKAEITKLMRKLNIKVDNLCQFLPQDSVTQFVKMNSLELLTNTLKAAGDNRLVDDHAELVELTKSIEEKRSSLAHLQKACKENEVNARRLETEVQQLRKREELVAQKEICSQKIYYVKYTTSEEKLKELTELRVTMKTDLKRIESLSEPYRKDMERFAQLETQIQSKLTESENESQETLRAIQKYQNSLENRKVDCQEEFTKFKAKQEQQQQRDSMIQLKQQELDNLECKLNELREEDCSRQLNTIEAEMAKIKDAMLQNQRDKAKVDDVISAQMRKLDELKQDIHNISAIKEKKVNHLRMKFPDSFRVLEWLAKNKHKFFKPILHPMMCEINVKDARYMRYVENSIPRPELASFMCQTQEDLVLFTRSVRDELRIKPNVILAPERTLDSFMTDISDRRDLSSFGVVADLKDLIEAPEPIMRYLCGSHNFHRVPVAQKVSETQLKQLLDHCPRFYADQSFYVTTKSRYDNKSMTVNDTVRDGQLLIYSLDAKRLAEVNEKYQKLREEKEENGRVRESLLKASDDLKNDWQQRNEIHRELKIKHGEKKRIELMISMSQSTLARLRGEQIDIEAERAELQKSIKKINAKMMVNLGDLARCYKSYAKSRGQLVLNVLKRNLVMRNVKSARKKYNGSLKDTSRLKDTLRRMQGTLAGLREETEELKQAAMQNIAGFKMGELDKRTKRKFNTLDENTVEELTLKKEDLTLRIQRIYSDSSNSILDEFNRQNNELQERRCKIHELESSLSELTAKRDVIKDNWLPKLNDVVDVINQHYTEFMRKLSYDGEVKLDYNPEEVDNFALYGISILVKYRDNEKLIPLSSTRQSGGERSVATMIYMLALQTKTSVPFRCVDEINQGMDKENERKVFELLVKTADSSSSQYFLVSPKLLNNLPYSSKMKIHIVFNGKRLGLAWADQEGAPVAGPSEKRLRAGRGSRGAQAVAADQREEEEVVVEEVVAVEEEEEEEEPDVKPRIQRRRRRRAVVSEEENEDTE